MAVVHGLFSDIHGRFFHDGRRLRAEVLNCVLWELRAIARLFYCRDVDTPSNNRQPSDCRFLPATILISYDASTLADADTSGAGGVGARQGYRGPGEYPRVGSSFSSISSLGGAWRGQEADVRVVEVRPASAGDVGAKEGARQGLGQVGGVDHTSAQTRATE